MLILAGTGHRPVKLVPKDPYSDRVNNRLIDMCRAYLKRFRPDKVISGFALGFDIALAIAAQLEDIYLIGAIPFKNQDSKWLKLSRDLYQKVLSKANEVIIVSEGGFTPAKMMARNRFMIDNCNRVLALYNGDQKGGTYNCVEYAIMQQKPITNLWNSWIKYR